MTWRESAKRNGAKSLVRCVQNYYKTRLASVNANKGFATML